VGTLNLSLFLYVLKMVSFYSLSDFHAQIFAARPMFPQIQTTPMAGSRLTSHIRALLLMFATYLPPPSSLSAANSVPNANRATRVPQEVLTDSVVEEIKTRCCFVGEAFESARDPKREDTPGPEDHYSDMDIPPSSDASVSGSDFSHAVLSQPDSEFSVVSGSVLGSGFRLHMDHTGGDYLQAIANMYKRHSTATDLQMKIMPPLSQQTGAGRGTLIIPGWIRERAAEVLFEGGDIDESSLAELILDTLLKVRTLSSLSFQTLIDCLGASRFAKNNGLIDPRDRWNCNVTRFYTSSAYRNCTHTFYISAT